MTKEIKFLIKIIEEANNISKEQYEIQQKGTENDLVTSLDFKIEEYLIKEIKKEYPNFDIISEELNTSYELTDNCFIIDPIDGTVNFASNIPLWGIQICMRKDGESIASIISLPRLNEIYYADKTGAYLNGEKININEVPLKYALYSIDGTNGLPSMQRLRKYSSYRRCFGSAAVSFAFVASGKLHGTVYKCDSPWDYEAGMFLCKMAGAKIKSLSGFHGAAMNQDFLDILEKEVLTKKSLSNIFVLHSLNGDTLKMWGQNIKEEFGVKDIDVFLPEFPTREKSRYSEFDKILKDYLDKKLLNEDTIVVAHSIGNPYFIRFCKEHNYVPKAYISVAPKAVYEYPETRNDYIVEVKKQSYIKKDILDYIKNMNSIKYCLYSDEDDNNKEEFERFVNDTNSKGIYLEYYNHFDGYHRIYKIPELNDLINKIL